jgi:hypothetical protein
VTYEATTSLRPGIWAQGGAGSNPESTAAGVIAPTVSRPPTACRALEQYEVPRGVGELTRAAVEIMLRPETVRRACRWPYKRLRHITVART